MTPPLTPTPAEHPTSALTPDLLATLAGEASCAVTAIAGRDSVAAAVAAVCEHGFRLLLPTVVLTGTEFGDFDAPLRAVEILRHRLEPEGTRVLDPIWLSSPALWNALNARFATLLAQRFGTWSLCSACHLYVHMCRIPLAWQLGSVPVVTGEREAHKGRVKLSQTPATIDAEMQVFAHAGVELLEPLRYVDDDATLDELVGHEWPEGGRQLGCVLSGNCLDLEGDTHYDETEQVRYANEFLIPAGEAIVDAWREPGEPDYARLVRRILTA